MHTFSFVHNVPSRGESKRGSPRAGLKTPISSMHRALNLDNISTRSSVVTNALVSYHTNVQGASPFSSTPPWRYPHVRIRPFRTLIRLHYFCRVAVFSPPAASPFYAV